MIEINEKTISDFKNLIKIVIDKIQNFIKKYIIPIIIDISDKKFKDEYLRKRIIKLEKIVQKNPRRSYLKPHIQYLRKQLSS